MKTLFPNTVERKWYLIDADGLTLGRLAQFIAKRLTGKLKCTYSAHIDGGDYVIVTNIDKIKTTGRKDTQKFYYTHSQYMGGLTKTSLGDLKTKKPFEPLRLAVAGMLPKNSHRDSMLLRLKQFQGAEHSHEAQTPEIITPTSF
jgi:large subunit ribosomal protein L13